MSPPTKRRVAGLLLAAGTSSRMKGPNKLLLTIGGVPVVRRSADALLEGGLSPIVAVTGHQAERVERALAGTGARIVHNPDYASGLASSLAAGIGVLEDTDGVLVALGDMPWVNGGHVRALLEALDPVTGRSVCVPVFGGRRGNPVAWASKHFSRLSGCTGDRGARRLFRELADDLVEVPVADDGVLRDVDVPTDVPTDVGADVPNDLPVSH